MISFLKRVISSREKALGADHPDTLSALANLGVLRQLKEVLQTQILSTNVCYVAWELILRLANYCGGGGITAVDTYKQDTNQPLEKRKKKLDMGWLATSSVF